ncbi:MAG: 50S ribosomal protein L31e [Candidatus Aenigmarchaeota archaeon]|nr:50S ribosomal protein L31e [Candidatus Aenigmarchaeota archaeon]
MAKTDERLYVIPLTDAWKSAYKKRAKKSISIVKAFASRHMKKDFEDIKIGKNLNELVWSKGAKNPPRKIKVRMQENDGKLWVELQGEKMLFELEKEKKAKEEKEAQKKQTPAKKEEPKAKESPKAETPEKKEEPKAKESPKAETPEKKEEPKDAPKKEEPKAKESPKAQEPKKAETPKKEVPKAAAKEKPEAAAKK